MSSSSCYPHIQVWSTHQRILDALLQDQRVWRGYWLSTVHVGAGLGAVHVDERKLRRKVQWKQRLHASVANTNKYVLPVDLRTGKVFIPVEIEGTAEHVIDFIGGCKTQRGTRLHRWQSRAMSFLRFVATPCPHRNSSSSFLTVATNLISQKLQFQLSTFS